MISRIVFSEAAREDRRDIIGYTVERFGIGQVRCHRLLTGFLGQCEPVFALMTEFQAP